MREGGHWRGDECSHPIAETRNRERGEKIEKEGEEALKGRQTDKDAAMRSSELEIERRERILKRERKRNKRRKIWRQWQWLGFSREDIFHIGGYIAIVNLGWVRVHRPNLHPTRVRFGSNGSTCFHLNPNLLYPNLNIRIGFRFRLSGWVDFVGFTANILLRNVMPFRYLLSFLSSDFQAHLFSDSRIDTNSFLDILIQLSSSIHDASQNLKWLLLRKRKWMIYSRIRCGSWLIGRLLDNQLGVSACSMSYTW